MERKGCSQVAGWGDPVFLGQREQPGHCQLLLLTWHFRWYILSASRSSISPDFSPKERQEQGQPLEPARASGLDIAPPPLPCLITQGRFPWGGHFPWGKTSISHESGSIPLGPFKLTSARKFVLVFRFRFQCPSVCFLPIPAAWLPRLRFIHQYFYTVVKQFQPYYAETEIKMYLPDLILSSIKNLNVLG